jgi:hypothetical protein
MSIEKEQQMMLCHLQAKKMNGNHKKVLTISNNWTDRLTAETGKLSA